MADQRTKAVLIIDRASREPAYLQLANILRQAIARGEYRSGDQLPTEAELKAALKLSKMTVRRALTMLIDQGIVRGTRGHGIYVQPLHLATASFDLSALQDLLTDESVTAKVLEARIVPAGPYTAATLALAESTPVVSIRQLLQRGAEPLVFHCGSLVYDPARPANEAALTVSALRDMFEGNASAGLKRGEFVIHAAVLNEEEADQLSAPPGAAAWVIEHVFYGYDEKPVSWGRFVCRAELLQFRASVGL